MTGCGAYFEHDLVGTFTCHTCREIIKHAWEDQVAASTTEAAPADDFLSSSWPDFRTSNRTITLMPNTVSMTGSKQQLQEYRDGRHLHLDHNTETLESIEERAGRLSARFRAMLHLAKFRYTLVVVLLLVVVWLFSCGCCVVVFPMVLVLYYRYCCCFHYCCCLIRFNGGHIVSGDRNTPDQEVHRRILEVCITNPLTDVSASAVRELHMREKDGFPGRCRPVYDTTSG